MLWLLSCMCLGVTGALCIAGVLSHHFNDNLLQRAGMALLGIFCFGRATSIWHAQFASADWFGVHLGMAVYALGTAWKVYARLPAKVFDRYERQRVVR